jgi:hypothetical protein
MKGRSEGGYVTITVIGLLLGLSIVLVSLTSLTVTKVKASNQISEGLVLDVELENAINMTLADLLEERSELVLGAHETSMQSSGSTLSVLIEDEASKIPALITLEAELRPVLEERGYSSAEANLVLRLIRQVKTVSEDKVLEQADVYTEDWPRSLRACFERDFTLFQPTRRLVTTSGSRESLDGAMLRLTAEGQSRGNAKRGLRAIVLITGRRDDPVWVFDWQRYSGTRTNSCRLNGGKSA